MSEVYKAISAVQGELAKVGISKDRKNQQQGYMFRGIDDVYGALAPLLSSNNLSILPRVLSRECIERQTAKGGALFNVVVHVEFDFVSSIDASKHTVSMFGEAMDSADKATNKAMSAAYKYACFQAFCIPTEGDNDADAHSPELATTHTKKFTDSTIRGWCSLAESFLKKEGLALYRDWYKANEKDILSDCGKEGAAEVFAKWADIGKREADSEKQSA